MTLFATSRLLSAAGVAHGFSLRAGGVSAGPFASLNLGGFVGDDPEAVRENSRRLEEAAGLAAGIATANQVHGDRVVDAQGREILAPTEPQPDGADAVLGLGEQAVGVRVADCVPVLIFAEDEGAAAAVHSGWRGTRLSIAARGVRALQHATGADPSRMLAAVGPSIGRCCYQVSAELASLFRAPRTLRGRVRIDMPQSLARTVFIPALPRLLAAHPQLEVQLGTTDRRVDVIREGF